MIVYCVCIEEEDDQGLIYRVEIFSTIEKAQIYIDQITCEDVKTDIVEYILDQPESGDTTYEVDDSSYSESDD